MMYGDDMYVNSCHLEHESYKRMQLSEWCRQHHLATVTEQVQVVCTTKVTNCRAARFFHE